MKGTPLGLGCATPPLSNPSPVAATVPSASSAAIDVPAATAVAAVVSATAAAQGSPPMGSSSAAPASHPLGAAAPAPRRYHSRVGPTPPSLPHPMPSRRAPPSKRAQTSGSGESSGSRPQEPQSPTHQGLAGAPPLDLSPASIIRRPLFHYGPVLKNVDCSERDLHDEVHYDLPTFAEDPELRDSMLLV